MTATARPGALVAGGLLILVATSLGVVREPVAVVVGLGAVLVVAALVLRVDWAVLAFVAAEPFGDLLATVHPATIRVFGLLLFVAWLVRLAVDHRPVALRHAVVFSAGALAVVVLASTAWHPNGAAGLEVAGRYASYLAVLVVLVDTMRTTVAPRRVVTVFLVSCSAAAVVGLTRFLAEGGRAAGPMSDPNDFAFYLVCALPFALLLWREDGAVRWLGLAAAALLTVTTFATFSRGGLVAIAVLLVVALVLGLVRLRHVAGTALVVLLGVGIVVVSATDVVERSLGEKQHVASANVDSRFTTWTMAAEMTVDHPVLGTGPGGFAANFGSYEDGRSTEHVHLGVAHQMYLDVASELGLLGLAAFTALLAFGVVGAWRGRRGLDPSLAVATCAALAGTLAAAIFLTEQYYLPIWLLVALGAVLDPGPAARPGTGGTAIRTGRSAPCVSSS